MRKCWKTPIVIGNLLLVPLGHGKFAVACKEDHALIAKWAWHESDGYAMNGRGDSMHRMVNGTPDDLVCDHINGLRLDNRRENLRAVTVVENTRDAARQKRPDGDPPGLRRVKHGWQATGCGSMYLGIFPEKTLAASAVRDHYADWGEPCD